MSLSAQVWLDVPLTTTSLWQPTQESTGDSLSVSGMKRLLEGGKRDGLDVEEPKQRIRHKRVQKPRPAATAGLHSGSQLWSCVHCGPGDLGEQVNVIMDYERVYGPSPSPFSDLGPVFSLPIGLEF